jgi:RimJ/RimL family protein N-acetyltransferase
MSEENRFGLPRGAPVPGWSARRKPPHRALTGSYCRVEPLSIERHAHELYRCFMEAPDGRDWTYLPIERPETLESLVEYLTRAEDLLRFAVIDGRTDTAVGTAALMRMDPANGVIELGSITFSPRIKRTRVSTEAIFLLMQLVFDELGYRRLEWKCDRLNIPSRAAAERYGFSFEGIFRHAVVYKGRNRDTAWYAMIAEEWPHIRQALVTWLTPENFDAAGEQRRSLREIRGP